MFNAVLGLIHKGYHMKKSKVNLFFLMALGVFIVVVYSCKKKNNSINDESTTGTDPIKKELAVSIFKNVSGDVNSVGLQAQLVNNLKHFTVNVFGTFNSINEPDITKAFTFNKEGNDTVVHLSMNAITKKLETSYLVVKGVKQPYVIKHEYIANNDSAIKISVYEFNWSTNTSVLKYEAIYNRKFGATNSLNFNSMRPAGGKTDFLLAVGSGLAVAEAAFYGTSVALLGPASGAVIAAITAVGPAVILVGAAVLLLSSNSNACEIETGLTNLPPTTPTTNPVTNTTNTLTPVDCSAYNVTFSTGMDQFGSIAIFSLQGGLPVFDYSVDNSAFQGSQVFNGPYLEGNHLIRIRSSNGCITQTTKFITPKPFGINIGADYQGGVIAYILQANDPGYDPQVKHGLIISPSDLNVMWNTPLGSGYATTQWTWIGGTSSALGTGNANTAIIYNYYGTTGVPYAALRCVNLVLDGYSDWYLPSAVELQKVSLNSDVIGGFTGTNAGSYASSTEGTFDTFYVENIGTSIKNGGNATKDQLCHIRAMRSF